MDGNPAKIQRDAASGKKTLHNPEPCLIGIDADDRTPQALKAGP
jgi:hypothetical protein